MKPKPIAEIVSRLYSAGNKNTELASTILDDLSIVGVDESDFDEKDDIISDANEWRKSRDEQLAEYDRCLECGTTLGRGTCEACRQDRADRMIERDIDETRGK